MASSASPSSPPESSSVRPIACNACRQRRSQCSKERPKCKRCREADIECIYEEARKITVNESYLRDLEAKARAFEETLQNPDTKGSASVPKKGPSVSNTENDEEITEGNALLEDFGHLGVEGGPASPSLSGSVKGGGFKGPGHSDLFLRSMITTLRAPRSMGKLAGVRSGVRYPDDVSLDLNHNLYEPGLLAPRRLAVWSSIRLPPIETARRYYAAQYTYIGTIFSFTDPTEFEKSLTRAYQSSGPDLCDPQACLEYAKILVILAFGQLYSVNQWIDFKGPPGFDYFTHALQLLPDVHEEGSILCVETLSLIGYFMQNMNRRDAAFLYIGMALRMAISLGLHQEVPDATLTEEDREHRRRVWWSVYSLDRILSVKAGNPITIQDEDIGVKPPSKLASEPEYCPAVVLRHYTELSRILGEVNKHVFRKGTHKSGTMLMASVKDIMRSLSKWHRELPDQLRFDPARLAISRESVSTLVHYYQCINMTARPLLFHVVQKRLQSGGPRSKDWKQGLSQTTVGVIETCVNAAQDSIKIMSIAAQRDLVATYGYMDSEHIFSAAIVLLMVCFAFPPDERNMQAMSMGLNLLKGMAERGNSYIGARYQLLHHLRSIIDPPSSAAPSLRHNRRHEKAKLRRRSTSNHATIVGLEAMYNASPQMIPSSPPVQSVSGYQKARGSFSGVSMSPQGQAMLPSFVTPNTGLSRDNMGFGQTPFADAPSAYHQPQQDATPAPQMMDHFSGVGGGGSYMPGLRLGDMDDMFIDVNMNNLSGDDDFGLWEAGFADPSAYDLAQLTQAAQMAVDQGVDDEGSCSEKSPGTGVNMNMEL
ncbi:C6 transcription factor [Pyricularia oryzae 70-15]|uniref:C6 transcription factor n=1 Tax=Pyricularia oryzae (strain 70-15 / ATCC MYA-4617 / FGSC 8958) TaxID=242507 RepID=G4NHG6_PYRO7|nr:C6 transcription factor [Pyricularia oryzae 70-15]EHA47676.1 C6 transcription factor [Pyricularia oryzae 70-15]